MADEQELLSPEELDDSKYWYDKYHGVRDVEAICKGQVAKLKALACKGTGEKKLDSPDREIKADSKDPQRQRIIKWLAGYDAAKTLPGVSETVDQIIALFPDKTTSCVGLENCCDLETRLKDAREQEKKEWVKLLLAYDHPILNKRSNCLIPSGEWQALKEE